MDCFKSVRSDKNCTNKSQYRKKNSTNKQEIKITMKFMRLKIASEDLINSRYSFRQVAQIIQVCVKMSKKKPNALHSVQFWINRHSNLNDGNK